MKPLPALSQLLEVPSLDPDDARRRKILSIFLLATTGGSLVVLAVTGVMHALAVYPPDRILGLYVASLATGTASLTLLRINWRYSGPAASIGFSFLLLAAAVFSDEPDQVSVGRSLFAFCIPIAASSVLIHPLASFATAGVSSLVTGAIALSIGLVPNLFAVVYFFALAFVSWLSSRSLEHALADLRLLNLKLDERVQERTRELAEALGKNKAMVESIADGVIVFDMHGQAIFANPAISALAGQGAEEIVGFGMRDLLGDRVDPEDRATVAELLRSGQAPEPSVKFEWGDRTVSMSVAPVRVGGQERIGTVAVFRDFTREAELDRMKSSFVSIASHELRTPLNAILGYTDMLQAGVYGRLLKKQRTILDRVVANIGHLLSLVNNLLDRAQIEAGTIRLHIAPFAPEELVDEVIGISSMVASSKEVGLNSDVASELPEQIQGDKDRLRQILQNLVGNAVKFTDEGSIDVRAYLHDDNHWALEVEDTGSGIPPEAHEYIFEPFRQVDSSITRESSGPGLGLSIVTQLAELMGGRIELESEVGKGSTFTVILPLVPPAPDREE
jgi:PAS domain S-box-containing protein